MPLDASIITQGQQPVVQLQNPLDAMGRVMQFKDLSNRTQMQGMQMQQEQQKFNDANALRQAQNDNTKVDANGNYSIDSAGMMTDLAKGGSSHLIPQVQQNMAAQKAAVIQNQMNQLKMGAQLFQGATDQDSWKAAKDQYVQMGLPRSEQIPDQFDPGYKNAMLNKAIDGHEYLANQLTQQGIDVKKQDLQQKRDQFLETQQSGAFKDLMGHAETSRQLPDVKQAYMDRYNAQKALDLMGNGDPNKLNPNQVNLISGEIAKIALGQAPTEVELQGITPKDAKMLQAQASQYASSHPEAGNQGAFVKVFRDYANTIQGGAQKVIDSNMGKLGNSYQAHLTPGDYQQFQNNYIKQNPNGPQPFDSNNVNQANAKGSYVPTPAEAAAELSKRQQSKQTASR